MLLKIFLNVLNRSITGGEIILIVLLLRLCLKKAPKKFSYLLFSVVLIRLLLPFSVQSPHSLLPVKPAAVPQDAAGWVAPQIDSGITVLDHAAGTALPVGAAHPMQLYISAATGLWLAGVIAILVYNAWSLVRLKKQLQCAQMQPDHTWCVPKLQMPFVLGVFRPRIYLPEALTGQERGYILLHEQAHIKRRDPLFKLLFFFALCLHWFNPLVWVAFWACGRDMEMCCDEAVIAKLGSKAKKDYAATLLALTGGRRVFNGTALAFGEGNPKKRIKNLLNYKKPASWMAAAGFVLIAAVICILIVDPQEPQGEGEDAAAQSAAAELPGGKADAPSPQKFADELAASFTIENGTAAFTVPIRFPEGYSPERLSIQVKGYLPMRGGDNMSLHAFEQEEKSRAWIAGQTYSEKVFEETPPDGTELVASFYLIEKQAEGSTESGEISKYYQVVIKKFPLRADGFTPQAEILSDGVTFSDRYGDTLTVELSLPEGWSLKASEETYAGYPAPFVDVLKRGERVGRIFCDEFDVYRDEAGEIPYRSVYSKLLLSSISSWDNEYMPMKTDADSEIALCRPRQNQTVPGTDNAASFAVYSKGILAYQAAAQKYVAIRLDDALVADAEWKGLAQGLKLSGQHG